MKKVKDFSKEELDELIPKDFSSKSNARFPTRFLIFESLEDFLQELKVLENHVDNVIRLSEFCFDGDVLPDINSTIEEALELVKSGKKVLLVSLSEFFRFRGQESRVFLNRLFQLEIDPNKNGRLIIPLYGIDNIFFEFWNKIPDAEFENRKKPAIRVLSDSKEIPVEVYLIKDTSFVEMPFPDSFLIAHNFKEYLEIWEELRVSKTKNKILLFSKKIYELAKEPPKGKVILEKINSPKEFLQKIFDIVVEIEFNPKEEKFWRTIVKEILEKKISSFEDYVRDHLNVSNFNPKVFSRWKNFEYFDRWLLVNWAKLKVREEKTESYLANILGKLSDFSEFEELIWISIFEFPESERFLDERRSLITSMRLSPPPKEFFEKISEIIDPIKKLRFLTNSSFEERKEIVKSVAECIKKGKKLEEILPYLEKTYPELYYYLQPPIFDKGLSNYIRNYLVAKICNDMSYLEKSLKEESREIDISKYVPRNEHCERINTSSILFIDGLGIEWMGLLYHYLKNKGYNVELEIAKSAIPTTTDFNRILENEFVIRDLDAIYHRTDLDYPDYIVVEVDTITKILDEKVDFMLNNRGVVYITSDHGSTRFSGWPKETIDLKIENYETYRNGRYIITDQQPPNSADYIVELVNGKFYAISTTHKVFRGGKRAPVENHGGATVEERLIPILKVGTESPIKTRVEILDKEISILKPIFRIRIKPTPIEKVYALLHGKAIEASKLSLDIWQFDLSSFNLKPGTYKIEIHVGKNIEVNEIIVKAGLEEEDLFG